MADDDVIISETDDSNAVTIQATQVNYTLNKNYMVDIKIPALGDAEPSRLIMDMKDIDKAIEVQGHLVGTASTDDMITLFNLASSSDGESIRIKWRSLTFDDCWIKSINITDSMSISGTTVNGSSQTFDSDQILSDTITFDVSVQLILGDKL